MSLSGKISSLNGGGRAGRGRGARGIARVTELAGPPPDTSDDDYEDLFRQDDGVRVEERLQLRHLQQLCYWFTNHVPQAATPSTTGPSSFSLAPEARPFPRQAGLLTPKEFKETIWKVLNTHDYDDQLDNLFTKLDTSCDGYVDWNEFCTYMLLQFRENDYMRAKKQIPFQAEPKIRHIVANRQETTSKVITIENPTKYVTVSKEGAVCLWDTALHLERSLHMTEAEEEPGAQRRRVREWVTDVVYMPNAHKVVIASTGRDLRFFDTTSAFIEETYLYALPDVPNCLCYHYEKDNPGAMSTLLYGDAHGAVSMLHFQRPLNQLFTAPFKKQEGVQRVYYQDLPQHDRYVRETRVADVHTEAIRKIVYMAENSCVMSSSSSPKTSLVILDLMRNKRRYVFRLSKGIDCFSYSKHANLLATGSADHLVRLWNPYVTSKPVALLEGHNMAIVDVVIHEGLMQVFSYSRDTALKVWDIREHTCLQTIMLKFPSSLLGRMPEYGPFAMHLQASPNALFVTANDYICQLKFGQSGPPVSLEPSTHLAQLCSAIYNPFFKQVVTGADDSTVGVWDLETGSKNMLFTNAHGKEEITCMAFDNTWRRLMTGARNGTIKIWNVQNGHNLQQLEAVAEAEVTGIVPLVDRKVIVSVGWNRTITQYDDADPDNMHSKAETTWKAGQLHSEDILTAAYRPPDLLATASYDGEIYVWAIETESVFLHLKKRAKTLTSGLLPRTPNSRPSSRPSSRPNSRPNSRHRSSHRPTLGSPTPCDKLMFLNGRGKVKRTEAAILVSSEAGTLRFWSLFSRKHEQGYFYAPEQPDESVLALGSDESNSVLLSGDTVGRITVWNIADYCLHPQQHRMRTRPPVENTWAAHDAAVVSVEAVAHDIGLYVLSASSDWTAKLWTTDGRCVGVFGQKKLWSLRAPQTWVDPGKSVVPDRSSRSPGLGDVPEEGVDPELEEEEDIPSIDRGDTLVADGGLLPSLNKKKAASVGPTQLRKHATDSLQRAQTFAFGSYVNPKRRLGSRVESQLARMTADRHERRDQFGEIDAGQTNRMGKICCPFQALITKDLSDIELPTNLPLPPRMLSRGLTNDPLTVDGLRTLDLSYLPGDTTPSSDQGNGIAGPRDSDSRKSHKLPVISRRTGAPKSGGAASRSSKRIPAVSATGR